MFLSKLLLAGLPVLCAAQPPGHEVKSLPGWPHALPSKHYSGYMPVGNTSGVPGHIHYWFIESENDPANDPVVYWTNGGPGGSGITTGLLTEMGQFQLDADSITNKSSVPNLIYNPYSWSKVANTVFVSQPKGVGFSYCDDASSSSECVNNDLTAAEDAYDFFKAFFEAYPKFAKNDFYLTAESYGGIYIPMFMDQMQTRGGFPNLKGAAIGDGCWGTKVGLCAFGSGKSQQIQAEFTFGHGMYDQPLYQTIHKECGNFSDHEVGLKKCAEALSEASEKSGTFDVYNIYDTCGRDTVTLQELTEAMSAQTVVVDSPFTSAHPQLDQLFASKHQDTEDQEEAEVGLDGGALNDYVCGRDRAAQQWLSQPEVAAALHVNSSKPGMHYNWGPYNVSGDLRPLYKELVQKYRMLIYSGDTDACVPEWGTEEWVRELGFDVKKDWSQWLSPLTEGATPQRAGYHIDYDTGATDFKFATVQGAGHMVPTYKPNFALTLLTRFLKNEEL